VFSSRITYDSEDRIREITDEDGNRRAFEYDAEGQLLAVRDGSGRTLERFDYDPVGNRLTTNGTQVSISDLNQCGFSKRCR
jgi:YD repeat-containing protein